MIHLYIPSPEGLIPCHPEGQVETTEDPTKVTCPDCRRIFGNVVQRLYADALVPHPDDPPLEDDDEEEESHAEPEVRICRLEPSGGLEFRMMDNRGPQGMHDLIGGYAETFPLPAPLMARSLIGLADEDGYRNERPYNVYSALLGRQIVGPVLIVRSDPPEFVSLSDDDQRALSQWFGQLEAVITVTPKEPRP